MRSIILVVMAALASCSPSSSHESDNRAKQGSQREQKAKPSVNRGSATKGGLGLGYPSTQPDGSPLTESYCIKVDEEADNPFDNTKTCVMVACEMGDKASCDAAATYNGNMWPDGEPPENTDAADDVLSSEFRTCFGKDAPLNAESYDCLDQEYHRLEIVLTKEYRAALARQPDEAGKLRLQLDERNWWRTRFRHCRDEVGDLRGSTATVVNENCEIDALAQRIVGLRHYGR